MPGFRSVAILLPLLLGSCTSDRVELLVDLRTDLIPGREFTVVETTLEREGGDAVEDGERGLVSGEDTVAGVRIAEFSDLKPGRYRAVVRLRYESDVVIERPVDLELRESFAVTVLITRDCRNIACDDPGREACLQGQCVAAGCAPESSDLCPDATCIADSDCPELASCAARSCADGACLYRAAAPAVCEEGTYCDPHLGCAGTEVALRGQSWGGSGEDSASALAIDVAGNIYVGGHFGGTVDFGGGPRGRTGLQAFVLALGPDGSYRWDWTAHADSLVHELAVDSLGRVAVGGSFRGTVDLGGGDLTSTTPDWQGFVVGLSRDGIHRWDWTARGASRSSIAVDQGGNVFVIGGWRDPTTALDLGDGERPLTTSTGVFAVSLTADGAHRWDWIAEGASHAWGATAHSDTDVFVVGAFGDVTDFGGGPRTPVGTLDAFAVKLDATGGFVWDWVAGSPEEDEAHDIVVDSGGSPIVVGHYHTRADFGGGARFGAGFNMFAVRLDTDGGYVWDWTGGGGGDDSGWAAALNDGGSLFVAGDFELDADFGGGDRDAADGKDIVLVEIAADGSWTNDWTFGGDENDLAWAVAVDAQGHPILAGSYQRAVDFGFGPQMSAGGHDIVLIRPDHDTPP